MSYNNLIIQKYAIENINFIMRVENVTHNSSVNFKAYVFRIVWGLSTKSSCQMLQFKFRCV